METPASFEARAAPPPYPANRKQSMPSRTEATRAKAASCATGRLTPLRLFSTLPFRSPFLRSMSDSDMDLSPTTLVSPAQTFCSMKRACV